MKRSAVFILLAAIASATVLVHSYLLINLPLDKRTNAFPDDAFYYLTPAQNISKGLGPTADGVTVTSGYHPLWMGCLSVLNNFVPGRDRELFFRAAVLSGSFLHLLAVLLIYLTARRFLGRGASFLWAVSYLFCESALLESAYAMETPLLAFLLTLFIWVCTSRKFRFKTFVSGFILGLIFLARTDSIFFIVSFGTLQLLHNVFAVRVPFKRILNENLLLVLAFFAAVSPWFMISYGWYGTFFQNSMLMKELWRARVTAGMSFGQAVLFDLGLLNQWFKTAFGLYPFLLPVLAFAGGAAAAGFFGARREQPADKKDSAADYLFLAVISLLLYVVLAGVFYCVQFSFVRSWYYGAARLLLPFTGIMLLHLCRRYTGKTLFRAVSVLSALAVLSISAVTSVKMYYNYFHVLPNISRLGQFIVMLDWVEKNTPETAVLGAYSSGTLSFYSGRKVINLDGLCNNDIYGVTVSGTMREYIKKMNISYVVDYEAVVRENKATGLYVDVGPENLRKYFIERHRVRSESDMGDIVALEYTGGIGQR